MPRTHPYLFLNADELARVRERVHRHEWARVAWADIRQEAERFLDQPVQCPPATGRGGNVAYYWCSEARHPLAPDPERKGVHVCQICHKEYRGPAYDASYANRQHHQLGQAAQDLALVGVVERDARFLKKAGEILLAYAVAFPTYPRVPGWAILSYARSEETMALLPLAFAYDLLAGAGIFSATEAKLIECNLLRAGMEDLFVGIGEGGFPLSNHSVWAVAGASILALCLNDDHAFRRAGASASGFRAALAGGLRDDAHWWEGSMNYHLHTLWALLLVAEASRHTRFNLYRSPHAQPLHDMLLAPLRFAGPDMALPAVNDSNRCDPSDSCGAALRMRPFESVIASICELGLARFQDPEFASVLHMAYRPDPLRRACAHAHTGWGGYPRTAFMPISLLYGVDDIPPGRLTQRHSRVLADQGFVRLGGDPGFEKPYLVLTYGEQDAGHKHADRLGFLYEYDGTPLLADSGYGFGNWKNTTIAHNTVVVDETSYSPTRGALRNFENLPWVKLLRVMAEQTCLAQGVTLERVQVLLPDALIDVVQVRSDRPHTFDYLLHSPGEWRPDVPAQGAAGPAFGSAAYAPLAANRAGEANGPWGAQIVVPTGNAEVMFPASQPLSFAIAATDAKLNVLALRRTGKGTTFTSVVLPADRSRGAITAVRRLSPPNQDRWIALELTRRDGNRVVFCRDADPALPLRQLGDLRIRARLAVFLVGPDGKVRETALVDGLVATQAGQALPVKTVVPPPRLDPPAAALLPGETREFVLYAYGAAPKGSRVTLSGGLRATPIRWRHVKETWQGRFTVTAPPTATPTLATLQIKPTKRAHRARIEPAPIAVLPPSVTAVVCRRIEAHKKRSTIETDSRWNRATAFYLPIVSNQVQRAFTQVKTFHDKTALYFRLTCGEPLMRQIVTEASAENPALLLGLFSDDHVEILLDTDGDPATYFQLGVNAANLGMAQCFGPGDSTLKWHHSVRRLTDRWEVYVTIPFGEVVAAPRRGTRWTVNVVRLRRAAGREDSAMVIGNGGYHCPKQFLTMKFL